MPRERLRPPVSGGKRIPDLIHRSFMGVLPPLVASSRDPFGGMLLIVLIEGFCEWIAGLGYLANSFQEQDRLIQRSRDLDFNPDFA